MNNKNKIVVWIVNISILISTILLICIFCSCFKDGYNHILKIILIILCIIVIIISSIYMSCLNKETNDEINENKYLDFIKVLIMKNNGNISKITINRDDKTISYQIENGEILEEIKGEKNEENN